MKDKLGIITGVGIAVTVLVTLYFYVINAGNLELIDTSFYLTNSVELRLFFGHTSGLIVPFIFTDNSVIVYTSDLIPVAANIPIPWITAYDIYPLTSMKEKEQFLIEAYDNNYYLLFEHDYYREGCSLKMTDKGVAYNQDMKLAEMI